MIILLKLRDITTWVGRELTQTKEIFFRRKVQPVCFVYPAQDNENATKLVAATDGTNLQFDIAAVSTTSGIHGRPDFEVVAAANGPTTTLPANSFIRIDHIIYAEAGGAGLTGTVVFTDGGADHIFGGDVTIGANANVEMLDHPITIVTTTAPSFKITSGAVADSFGVYWTVLGSAD